MRKANKIDLNLEFWKDKSDEDIKKSMPDESPEAIQAAIDVLRKKYPLADTKAADKAKTDK